MRNGKMNGKMKTEKIKREHENGKRKERWKKTFFFG